MSQTALPSDSLSTTIGGATAHGDSTIGAGSTSGSGSSALDGSTSGGGSRHLDASLLAFIVSILLLSISFLLAAYLEPRFLHAESSSAEAAREMLVRGDLITPYYYGAPLFHIPALSYWLIVASYKLFGVSLVAARLPSVVAGLCLLAISGIAVRKLIDKWAGVFMVLSLGTAFGFAQMASACMCDMLLALFDVVALIAGFRLMEPTGPNDRTDTSECRTKQHVNTRVRWALLAGSAVGLGLLTKGPIALILPLGCCFFYALVLTMAGKVNTPFVTLLKYLPAIALPAILIATPWYLVAYQANGVSALSAFLIHENLQRFTGSDKLLGVFKYSDCLAFTHKPHYMLKSLLSGFLPWSPLLVIGSFVRLKRLAVRNRMQEQIAGSSNTTAGTPTFNARALSSTPLRRACLFSVLWIIIHTSFFSFARSNWSYYNLPVYPACALLLATFLWSLSVNWRKNALVSAAAILAGTIAYHAVVTPARAESDMAPAISDSLAHIPPDAKILIHFDFVMQYLLSDLIALKSNRIPAIVHIGEIEKAVTSGDRCYVLIAEDQLPSLAPPVRQSLKHVSTFPFQRTDYTALKDRIERNVPVSLMVLTNSR